MMVELEFQGVLMEEAEVVAGLDCRAELLAADDIFGSFSASCCAMRGLFLAAVGGDAGLPSEACSNW